MRGRYDQGKRRVLTSSGYIFTIGVVIAIAIALAMVLLVFLPIADDTISEPRTVVSIECPTEMGLNDNLSKIYCKVHYSDGTSAEVVLTDMIHDGLDIRVAGTQNVSLNYGGFEQTVSVEVRDVNCALQYQASVGGRIQGESVQSIPNGSDGATVIAIPETGYVFEKWNDGFPYATRKDKSVNKDATYIAIFKKATYTVRFYYSDGTVAVEEQVAYGEAPSIVPNPDADPNMQVYGYRFSNWIPAEFSSIDRDMVIRPEYEKAATDVEIEIPTDIYGNSMGTTDLNEYGYYAYGEMATITATPFNSRKFAYWLIQTSSGEYQRLDAEGTGTFTVGSLSSDVNFTSTKLNNNQYILSFMAGENINKVRIKAIFAYEESSIRFVNNQGEAGNVSYMLYYGKPIGSMVEDSDFFTVDKGPGEVIGMKFLGWYTEGTNIEVTADSTFEQPTTVIAKWEKRTYTVRFYYDDAAGNVYDRTIYVQYQNTLASGTSDALGLNISGIPTEIPQKEHYIFVGWQNSITGEPIDDKTKVVVNPLYLDQNGKPTGDFANRIIVMTPIFRPITHKLTVAVTGAGSVSLNIKEGAASNAPEYTLNEINGVLEIREDYVYTVTFEASTGYALSRVIWTDRNGSTVTEYSNNEDNVTVDLNVLGDNDIIVEFEHKRFDVGITIDESVGSIKYLDAYIRGNGSYITFKVEYNASINLIVGTVNTEYAIDTIKVDGVYLTYENGEFVGAGLTEYTLTLEGIRNNTEIEINYKSNSHKVITPVLSQGSIKLTSIYNPTVTTDIIGTENEYVHGAENVYRITAPANGYYISGIKINGYAYDLYNSGRAGIVYHNWYVNSVASQITVIEVYGVNYYHYGDFAYGGKTYAYCQTVGTGSSGSVETAVFEVSFAGGNRSYAKIIDTAIINAGYSALNVAARDIYSTVVTKDLRITSMDLLLVVDMNYSIDITFAPISYKVTVEESSAGRVTISNSTVGYSGTSTVIATPKTGYYIYGYTINGGDVIVANLPDRTSACPIRFTLDGANDNRIREDKRISFIYRKIQVFITVRNTTTEYPVYFDGQLLNSSIDKTIDYKGSASYEITLDDANYRISSVTIDGEPVNNGVLHYNLTSYTLTFNDATESVIVEIACAPKTSDVSEGASTYSVTSDEANVQNVTYSLMNRISETTAENRLIVTADTGYYISSIILTGSRGNSLSQDYADLVAAELVIPANTFEDDEVVSVLVVSNVRQYNIVTTVVNGPDLDFVKLQNYGARVEINVMEIANYFISSFRIDGNEISFDSNNWSNLVRNTVTREYISGIYTLTVTKDTSVYLEYSLNVYTVTLDANSINGTTTISAEDPISGTARPDVRTAKYGENLNIKMVANEGYHIKSLYINNVKVNDLNLPSVIDNNNVDASYAYRGINSNIVVRVVYEINRYSFTYEIVNISENFALYDTEPGTLTTESNILAADGNKFTGIEYGRNFYINAVPATLNGYYLVSIMIRYRGTELVIPAGDNKLISARGGTIYFNTLLDFNEGIRQDIELIRLTFNKYTYDLALHQESEENTGRMLLSYSHPNSATNPVALFGSNGKIYYYLPDQARICEKVNNIFVPAGLELTFDADDGGYYYVDAGGNVVNLKIEHGIRYNVTAAPATGYRRTHFILNGNDVNSSVNNNSYSVNIVRNTSISVEYVILTFNVNFSLKVADKNLTGRIPDSAILNYATISIVDITDPYYPITYTLGANTSYINKVFNYGTRIRLVMTPKFDTTGYYLYNMYYKEREINTFDGDVRDTIIYGGEEGIMLNSDITATANFRITRYSINTAIEYLENITGESANTLINEGTSTIAWGDTATVRVASGKGYELGEIYVKRGNGTPIFVTLTPTEEQLATDLQKYVKNDYSVTNGTRDIIVVREVKSDILVTAKFIRKQYTVNFNFTNVGFLENEGIVISLNKYNAVYPRNNAVSGSWNNTTYIIPARYHDELDGIIVPKNGYEIMQTSLTIRAVYWDEATLSYKNLKDNAGNDIVYILPLTKVTGDTVSFTFHEPTKIIADLTVQSDLMIDLTVRIKTYTVETRVNRSSSASQTPNTTAVTMSVKTQANQNVRVDNVPQVNQTFTPTNPGKIYIAEHHGYIEYTFDAPEGYMLSNIFVNGINWDENMLRTASYTDSYLTVTVTKVTTPTSTFYRYVVNMKVKDPLIEGSPNYVVMEGMADVTVELTVRLITYEIKAIINGIEYDSTDIDNRNTFTDGRTIKVVTPDTTNHYNMLNIAPEIYEGYRVTSMNMSVYNNGVLTDIGYAFNISISNTLQMTFANLKYVDVISDNLVLYICYNTEIKRYNVDIFAYAYSIDMWPDKTEGTTDFDSPAGNLNVSALTNGVRTQVTTAYNHEYFTVVTAVAYAKESYIMYAVQEYTGTSKTGDWLTSGNWTDVKDGVRGISYSSVIRPNGTVEYTFEYGVNDLGDRTFRVVFRQQTTVTINVINPYRFAGTVSGNAAVGNMNYIYYPEIVAKIGGVEIPNLYDNGDNKVVDTYIYKVNVGSVILLSFFDNGVAAPDTFGIYYLVNDQYVENTEIRTTGFEIRARWDFYLKAKTKLYITYQKETNAASSQAVGGAILFGLDGGDIVSNEGSPLPVYKEAAVTQTVTIVVEPYENYIFNALKVRQIDQAASRLAGRIIYKQGSAEWLTYNPANFDSLDSNGFRITQSTTPAGNMVYTIVMTGNMELSFVFYKTYNVTYTSEYSDTGSVDNITLKDNRIYNNLCDSLTQVSYNSYFTLIAPQPDPDLYQFVGWYVNGVNIYKYLSTRYPDQNRFTNLFEINGTSMSLTYNNVELDDIVITAMYQRILNVALINELYYYDTATMHWNSWTTGAVRTQYYDYVSTQGLPLAKSIENVNNRTAEIISTIIGSSNLTYNKINSFISGTPAGNDTYWNTLSLVPAGFDRNTLRAYSSSTFFKVLYQNVTDEDYINDTWKTSDIELMLTGLPNTVRLQAWQYYNWIDGTYEDIGYSYEDPSGLTDSMGNDIIIDCTNTEYVFNLGYIYSGEMEGAIANAQGEIRPLIIRPFLRKVVSVELTKLSYVDYLGGNYETDFASQVGPSIDGLDIVFPQTNNFYNSGTPYQYISDDSTFAEFDYGARIKIRSYRSIDSEGNPVYRAGEENYRFVGWFLNWEVNGTARYRYVLDDDGTGNKAGENYHIYMSYPFGEEPPEDDTIQYRAVYINQYEHKIYSYNIAGGETYEDAFNGGQYAYKDAPAIDRSSLRINTQAVTFATFDATKTGNGRAGTTELYYNFEIVSGPEETHKLEFYIDIGCVYSFDLDMSHIDHVANYVNNNQYANPYGYDPAYDKQHKIKFSSDAGKENAYAQALSANYVFAGINAGNPVDSEIPVSRHLQIDIQYITQVRLVFKKLMWKAGITLPYNLSDYITNGNIHALTVWDYYTNAYSGYGDTVTSTPDGTVHVYFDLEPGRYTNFYNDGIFKYVPFGYKEGQGIPLNKLIYNVNTGNNNQTLFSPAVPQYRRHIEIDLSTYLEGGTLLFGDPNYSGDAYSTANTGEGTSASPYRIFTAQQLKNINLFWYYNEFSCVNSSGQITYFKLFADINLQGLNVKSSDAPFKLSNGFITDAWVPLCYAADESTNGFDGVLVGNDRTVYGLAALGRAGGNLVNTSSTSDVADHLRYDYSYGYGIFGLIKGGTVSNLKIGNAYIDVASLVSGGAAADAKPGNVGVLAAVVEDASITDITFAEFTEIGRYGRYRIYINGGTGTNGVGILAGLVKNSIITDVSLDVYTASVSTTSPNISINGENAGTLIGSLIDDYHAIPAYNEGNISSVITNLVIKSTDKAASSNPKILINLSGTQKYAGGVIGYMEAQDALVVGTKINPNNNNVVFEIGNTNSAYTGGVVGRLKLGTLKNTTVVSHPDSYYRIAETAEPTLLVTEVGGVGGIAGYNSGTIINVDVTRAPGMSNPYSYTYTNGIIGTFNLYGPIVGGIAGVNNVQTMIYNDLQNPQNSIVITTGAIVGFRLDVNTSTRVKIYAPYIMKGSTNIASGAKGGIAGYNKMGALIDDCSFGDSDASIAGSSSVYLYVYDQNAKAGYELTISDDTYNHNTHTNNDTGMASYVIGNLYVGGIAGATKGAIYNSFVANREIFVKYYNAIADASYKWNIFVGGIAGAQNFDTDELAINNTPDSYDATKETILSHPNTYTVLQYIYFDWQENNGILTDEIMKASLAQRAKVQSCYVRNTKITLGVYIWCDNNEYKAKENTGEEPMSNEFNFVGMPQNIVVGGVVGFNNRTAGTSSVNHCYSYNVDFNVKIAAYGAGNKGKNQYGRNVGYYYTSFLEWGWFEKIYANRIGTQLGVYIKGVVGGRAPDNDSVASFCWTYGCTVNNANLRSTGDLANVGSDQNDMYESSSQKYKRLISITDAEVNPDTVAIAPGYYYFAALKALDINVDKYWGYDDPSDTHVNTLTERVKMVAVGGFVGWNENPDGRLYRTDAETGMLMVWHADLRNANSINSVVWYETAIIGMNWCAVDGSYYKASYSTAAQNADFLASYLVRGQLKIS